MHEGKRLHNPRNKYFNADNCIKFEKITHYYFLEKKLSLGCKFTPERGSHYCEKHKSEEPVHSFRVRGGIVKIPLNQIKVQRGECLD